MRSACLALLLVAFVPGACSTAPAVGPGTAVVIGVDVPRGSAFQAEADLVVGAVRGIVESRYHGRLEGVPVTVRVLDDTLGGRPDAGRGASNLRTLALDPHVLGVVGPLQSNVAVAEIPVASAAHLVLVSPAASNACLTRTTGGCDDLAAQLRGGRPTSFFRTVSPDDGEVEAAALLATGTLGAGSVAVASDGDSYGRVLADAFAVNLRRLGGTVVIRRDLSPRSRPEVDTFLKDAAAGGARAVFFAGRDAGGACLVRAASADLKPGGLPFLGPDGILSPVCLKDAGPDLGSVYALSSGQAAESSVADAAEDAAGALLEAIARAVKSAGGNQPTREEVRSQMARTRAYEGHGGAFGFDANGDSTLRAYTVWSAVGKPPAWTRLKTIRLP